MQKKAQQLTLGLEMAAKNVCELQQANQQGQAKQVHKVSHGQREGGAQNYGGTRGCFWCGNPNHGGAQ